ncbi:MAG: flippase-like domain-containing protein, partial [Pseudonocardiales bacterium]|nr:flippase-like domain-containing protein [Pseudonocardiales bacterium]
MTAPTLHGIGGDLAVDDDPRPETPSPPVAINGTATTLSGRRRWRALVGCLLVALVGVEAGLVGPDLAGVLRAVSGANAGWLIVAMVAAAASMSMFARARGRLLRAAGVVVTRRGCLGAVYAANSLHASLPGGGAFSTGYSFRWMRRQGASPVVATWCLAANGLVSTGCLVALGLLGSLLAQGGASAMRLTMEITSVLALAMCARYLSRRPDRVVAASRWVLSWVNRVRHRHGAAGADMLAEVVAQLRSVRPSGRDWTVATGVSLLNWAFDAGCLAACAAALSVHGLTLPLLLVAYTAGMASSGLSLIPGGIGVVEPALILALVAGGVPAAAALPAVVLYRLISLVGVVAAGWIVFAVQQWRRHRAVQGDKSPQRIHMNHPATERICRPCEVMPAGLLRDLAGPQVTLLTSRDSPRTARRCYQFTHWAAPGLGHADLRRRRRPGPGCLDQRGSRRAGATHAYRCFKKAARKKWLTVHRYEQFWIAIKGSGRHLDQVGVFCRGQVGLVVCVL